MTALVSLLDGADRSAAHGPTAGYLGHRLSAGVSDGLESADANGITNPDRIVAKWMLRSSRLGSTTPSGSLLSPGAPGAPPISRGYEVAVNNEPLVDLLGSGGHLAESGWQNHRVAEGRLDGPADATVDFTRRVRLRGHPRPERARAQHPRWLVLASSTGPATTGGDVAQAVAGYYQGLRSVREQGPKPETVAYVANVLALRGRFVG